MNKINVYGRVSTDVELRDINGRSVANFGVAAQNKHKDKEGKYGTNFYRAQVWGAAADVASKYLKKGHRVAISGDLVARDYMGNDNQRHFQLEIQNGEFDLVETRSEAEAKALSAGGVPAVAAPATPAGFTPVEDVNGGLPF